MCICEGIFCVMFASWWYVYRCVLCVDMSIRWGFHMGALVWYSLNTVLMHQSICSICSFSGPLIQVALSAYLPLATKTGVTRHVLELFPSTLQDFSTWTGEKIAWPWKPSCLIFNMLKGKPYSSIGPNSEPFQHQLNCQKMQTITLAKSFVVVKRPWT